MQGIVNASIVNPYPAEYHFFDDNTNIFQIGKMPLVRVLLTEINDGTTKSAEQDQDYDRYCITMPLLPAKQHFGSSYWN